MPGSDWLANVYLTVFLFGLVFTIASVLLGAIGDLNIDLNSDGHVDFGGHHAEGHSGPSILNLPTIMAFFTWFGGVGYLLTRSMGLEAFISVPVALVSGLVGGGIMFALLARVLWPMMTKPMTRAEYSLPGTPARVVSPIRAGGVGEIVYTKSGSRFTAGARSIGEQPVEKGTEVVIVRYERGIAYVQAVDEILAGKE